MDNSSVLPHGYVLQGAKQPYVIERPLGQGSFGITYLAKFKAQVTGQMGSGNVWMQVCVKEFFMRDMNSRDERTMALRDATGNSLVTKYRRAFMREACNLARMKHPGIVNVFEVIETNNTAYIVMEYIDGGSLDEYIAQRGRLPEKEALACFEPVCDAMCYMHAQRMLHLDMKPKNVMRDEEGYLYLIDFGLSKQYTENGEPESSTSIGLGTPGYAPLEQAQQRDDIKDFRTTLDVYALGATLFKMLTGQTPPMSNEVNDAVLDGDNLIQSELRRAGVSAQVAKVVAIAMWPGAKKRYQTVPELMKALGWIPRNYQSADSHSQAKPQSRKATLADEKTRHDEEQTVPIIQPQNESTVILQNTGKENGHEWVDLGLSVKWATMNVGATSPEGYGSYFAWGETKPKNTCDWSTYKWCKRMHKLFNGSETILTKYCIHSKQGMVDNNKILDLSDDVARVNWGGNWRMPTLTEQKELEDKCTGVWTTQNGIMGYKVISKINGNSIFFPAAGFRWNDELSGVGSSGYYWSSMLDPSNDGYAYGLYFNSGGWGWSNYDRSYGRSVRAVCP